MLLYCTLLFSTVLLELIKIKKSLLKYNAVESIEELKNTIKISILICAREYKLYEHPFKVSAMSLNYCCGLFVALFPLTVQNCYLRPIKIVLKQLTFVLLQHEWRDHKETQITVHALIN